MQLCIEDIMEEPFRMASFTYASTSKPAVKFSFIGTTNSNQPVNATFAYVETDTTWKGDVVVVRHMVGNHCMFADARPTDLHAVVQFIGACLAIEP